MKRRLALVVPLALGLMALAWPAALGEYRGSDLLANVSPESRVAGGLVDRYPLSAYSLDYRVDVDSADLDAVTPTIAQWAAAQLWSVTSFLVKAVIDLFTWAFSLDLLNGDPARPDDGALAPVGDAVTSIYENVIGQAWMVAAILIAGIWGIWKALVQRRYTETAGALALSVLFVVVALFFVYQPERTIGEASRWTNTLSLAFLSGANRGSLEDPDQAKRQVADHLFETLVYRPWTVLEFGGLRHCVDTGRLDADGFPRPVGPHDAARDVCRDHLRQGSDGYGGYAARFLRQPAGSDERAAEYEALRKGETPGDNRQFAGYRVDKADTPAVDIQQAGGAFQRLTFATVVFVGALGAVVLIGFLSLAVILAQVVALVLLGFAPVALVIGIFPGAGHEFFRNWLAKLATAVFVKVLYSLVIAIVVAVSAALASATGSLGFLFAFGLQTLFFWAIFLYRKQITARLVAATTGAAFERLPRMTLMQRGAHAAGRPLSALGAVTGLGATRAARQESALAGGAETASLDGTAASEGASPSHHLPLVHANGNGHPFGIGEHGRNGGAPRRTPGDPPQPTGASCQNGRPVSASPLGPADAAAALPGAPATASSNGHAATVDSGSPARPEARLRGTKHRAPCITR